MPAQDKIRQITTILNLYYIDQLTQTEIAERLNLSVSKVNRLLQQARELGYIEFIIRTPCQHLIELENRLKAIFGLQEAIVVPSEGNSSNSILNAVGSAAANYLLEHIRDCHHARHLRPGRHPVAGRRSPIPSGYCAITRFYSRKFRFRFKLPVHYYGRAPGSKFLQTPRASFCGVSGTK